MTAPKELRNGRYVLVRTLGEGSQGETYEAIDRGIFREEGHARDAKPLVEAWDRYVQRARNGETRGLGEHVAIKCFRVGKAKVWKDVELAEREARTLAALDHPRLPKYIEHFEEDGALYLVMERIEGESLAALRDKTRSWSAADVTRMLEDISDALRYLHGRSPFIVHRDIKPGNIIRRPDGSYALVDFGSVRDRLKLTGGSTVVGTFGYMAPEQFQGRASPKSDLYGLGATAIAMLTGSEPEELPHEGLGIDVARALPKGTPTPLVHAITAMLVPDPDRRVESVDAVLAMLRARTEKRRPKSQRKRQTREERRRRRAAARARRPPLLPRLIAQLALLLALITVWVAVGLVTPLVLVILSLLFGSALRRAAKRCVGAARRAQQRIGRTSDWLSGHRSEDASSKEPERIRVPSELDPLRISASVQESAEMHDMDAAEHDAADDVDDRLRRQSAPVRKAVVPRR